MLKPKQIKQALAARDMALTLSSREGGYADDRMRIEYRPGPTHEITVRWINFVVLNVVWREHDDAMVISYRGGPWEWHLRRKAGHGPAPL